MQKTKSVLEYLNMYKTKSSEYNY